MGPPGAEGKRDHTVELDNLCPGIPNRRMRGADSSRPGVTARRAWPLRAGVIAAAALGMGCDGPSAREYLVTLTESRLIDCNANESPLLNEVEIEMGATLAGQVEDAWTRSRFDTPPRPMGRTLQVTEREGEMRSWFEEDGLTLDFNFAFGPGEVYVGHPDEDIVEGTFEARRNVTLQMGIETTVICLDLLDVRSVLAATLVDGQLDGRIRRTERAYFGSIEDDDYCELRFECLRDIAIEGVENDE